MSRALLVSMLELLFCVGDIDKYFLVTDIVNKDKKQNPFPRTLSVTEDLVDNAMITIVAQKWYEYRHTALRYQMLIITII